MYAKIASLPPSDHKGSVWICSTGLIGGLLTKRYGCRFTGMLGGVLSTVGFLCSYWVISIGQMYLMVIVIGRKSRQMVPLSQRTKLLNVVNAILGPKDQQCIPKFLKFESHE